MSSLPILPPASLPQNDGTSVNSLRKAELQAAKQQNKYDFGVRIPGVVTSNSQTSDLKLENDLWALRGTQSQQDADRLNQYNFKTILPDGIGGAGGASPDTYAKYNLTKMILTSVLPTYANRNPGLFASSTFVTAFTNLKKFLGGFAYNSGLTHNADGTVTNNVIDGSPANSYSAGLNIFIDPVVFLVPSVKPTQYSQIDFFPDYEPYFKRISFERDFRDDDVIPWIVTSGGSATAGEFLRPFTAADRNKFPITDEKFRKLARFQTDFLANAMQENRLFISDFGRYANICAMKTSNGGKLFPAMALFAVPNDGSGVLKVIAIQATQTPALSEADISYWKVTGGGDELTRPSMMVTPADDYWSWQIAKNTWTTMYCMSDVFNHLSMHLYIEPIPVAIYRNLSKRHPLYPLLTSHTYSLINNNFIGVNSGLNVVIDGVTINAVGFEGGPHAGVLSGAMSKIGGISNEAFVIGTVQRKNELDFNFHGFAAQESRRRELATIKSVPNYDDDQTFPIIAGWVSDYLNLYYSSDQDVLDDTELQAFVNELAAVAKVKGFPSSVTTLAAYKELITRIIYWLCVNHTFGNFSSYVPLFALGYFDADPPTPNPSQARTEADWYKIMPPVNLGLAQFAFARIFTDIPDAWYQSLGKYPYGTFLRDARVAKPLKAFQTNIKTLDVNLRNIQAQRRWYHDMRMPSTMTVSGWN